MADDRKPDQTFSALPSTGIGRIDTVRGPVQCREVEGVTTIMVEASNKRRSILLLTYGEVEEAGLMGLFSQLDAEGARSVGASLFKLADMLEPMVKN